MSFVAKQYLKSKVLLHTYNLYINPFTTPSAVHCPLSSAHQGLLLQKVDEKSWYFQKKVDGRTFINKVL